MEKITFFWLCGSVYMKSHMLYHANLCDFFNYWRMMFWRLASPVVQHRAALQTRPVCVHRWSHTERSHSAAVPHGSSVIPGSGLYRTLSLVTRLCQQPFLNSATVGVTVKNQCFRAETKIWSHFSHNAYLSPRTAENCSAVWNRLMDSRFVICF